MAREVPVLRQARERAGVRRRGVEVLAERLNRRPRDDVARADGQGAAALEQLEVADGEVRRQDAGDGVLHGLRVGREIARRPRCSGTAVPLQPPRVRNGHRAWLPAARARRVQPVLVKLTSGSTGQPRALPFIDAHMLADGSQICAGMDIRATDLNLAIIPFGHSYGLGTLVLPLLLRYAVAKDLVPAFHLMALEHIK